MSILGVILLVSIALCVGFAFGLFATALMKEKEGLTYQYFPPDDHDDTFEGLRW